ncbi:MAG: DHHA1 domain-containing protein, partial [Rikenellaceae bacterium]
FFKIKNEGAISAGIRRIEAVTGQEGVNYVHDMAIIIEELKKMFNSTSLIADIIKLRQQNTDLTQRVEDYAKIHRMNIKNNIQSSLDYSDGINWYVGTLDVAIEGLKDIALMLKKESAPIIFVVGTTFADKPSLIIMISDDLVASKGLNAANIVREAARQIEGGGGGQPSIATAGGKNTEKLGEAIDVAMKLIKEKIK